MNKGKKTLFVDMDEVCCSFVDGVKSFEPDMIWDEDNVNRVCLSNPRLFLSLPTISGAKEALNELKDIFDIYFASVPMWILPESWMDKRIYLQEIFGDWVKHRLILIHNKGLLKGDFIIDDRTAHGVDKFEGEHLHFGTEKFPNWETITEYLKIRK